MSPATAYNRGERTHLLTYPFQVLRCLERRDSPADLLRPGPGLVQQVPTKLLHPYSFRAHRPDTFDYRVRSSTVSTLKCVHHAFQEVCAQLAHPAQECMNVRPPVGRHPWARGSAVFS